MESAHHGRVQNYGEEALHFGQGDILLVDLLGRAESLRRCVMIRFKLIHTMGLVFAQESGCCPRRRICMRAIEWSGGLAAQDTPLLVQSSRN